MELLDSRVVIIKLDGTVIKDVAASVQKKIYLKDITLPVEVGDTVEQLLPSGLMRVMIVTGCRVYDVDDPDINHISLEYIDS